MIDVCGASSPLYKKLYCCFSLGHTSLHGAPIRRGQWVEWVKAGTAVARRDVESPVQERVPRLIYVPDEHYGRIGIKSKGRCWYCGVGFSSLKRTLDHVVPRSKGGANDPCNLVFACQPCNAEKASMMLDVYRVYLQHIRRVERVVFYGESLAA